MHGGDLAYSFKCQALECHYTNCWHIELYEQHDATMSETAEPVSSFDRPYANREWGL